MSVYVFLGPTLPVARAEQILSAHYLPPVAQGDILALLPHRPRAIGIIDGKLGPAPAVSHKEVLAALESGSHVFGAASMGALRAAELDCFGMRGVGAIYAAFAQGRLEDDDEVAVRHAPAELEYRESSVAMVNLRDLLQRASAEKHVERTRADALERGLKALPYGERSYAAALRLAQAHRWPAKELCALRQLIEQPSDSLEQRDAMAMLEAMRVHLDADPAPFAPEFKLERTASFVEALAEVSRRAMFDHGASSLDPETKSRTGETLPLLRKKVLLHILARAEHARLGLEVRDVDVQAMARDFRRAYGLEELDRVQTWLESEGLDLRTFTERLADLVTLAEVQEHYGAQIEAELGDFVRLFSARTLAKREAGEQS